MKKRLKRLIGKKGLTLVEILVVLIVSSILIGIAMGMLAPVRNLMNAIKGNAHLDALCDTANEYIRGRLQNAVSVTMMKAETSDSNSIVAAAQKYIDDNADNKTVLKAIAVLKDDSDSSLYRLYDFGTVVNGGSYLDPVVQTSALKGYIENPSIANNDYAVFRKDFYENTSYSLTFDWDTHSGEAVTLEDGTPEPTTTVSNWIKVTSTCFRNGDQVNPDRSMTFKIFGGKSEFVVSGAEKNKEGSMIILYTVKDTPKYDPPDPAA